MFAACRSCVTTAPNPAIVGVSNIARRGRSIAEHRADAGNDARGGQRMTAEFEEVVVGADPRTLQQVDPDFQQHCFRSGGRRRVLGLTDPSFGCTQGRPVNLAVGQQGHRVKKDEGCGNDGRGQVSHQIRTKLPAVRRVPLDLHHVSGQFVVAPDAPVGDNRAGGNCGVPRKYRSHFPGLDPHPPDLDLIVDAPGKLQQPVGTVASPVTCAIDQVSRFVPEWIRDKTPQALFREIHVAEGAKRRADRYLARLVDAAKLACRPEQQDLRVWYRLPDRLDPRPAPHRALRRSSGPSSSRWARRD